MFTNEEAVSPVIGTILMVAVTVVLAAVIAAFVFGMMGNFGTNSKIVAFHAVKASADVITVTNMGGHDAQTLDSVAVAVPSVPSAVQTGDATVPGGTATLTAPGAFNGRVQVTVTGTFGDGSRQVLLDTYL